MNDGSFFQFSYDKGVKDEIIRLAFYPSICSISYEEFLLDVLDEKIEDIGAEFIEDYQQFLIEQIPNNVTPMRYDYNAELYIEMIHSSAYIHIRNEENVRIPYITFNNYL